MFLDYLLSILFLAGFAFIWRRLLNDFPIEKNLKRISRLLAKALSCSTCFNYWFAFLFSLLFSPLGNWIPANQNFIFGYFPGSLVSFFINWFLLGAGAVVVYFTLQIMRFVMEILYEYHEKIAEPHEH